ncbi:MAG: iron-sulfur cluster assembly accessory protein [Chlamydiia bacterium]
MITKEMTIEEILNGFPEKSQKLAQAITDAGLHCVGCHASSFETLEAGMLSHGYEVHEIEALLGRLNTILKEVLDLEGIQVTAKAVEAFKEIAAGEGLENAALRFDCIPGGCSGYQYVLDFSEKADAELDQIFHSNGLEIHIDKHKVHLLLGVEIDYHSGLNGAGFKISNPNAKSSCGCGKSQSY